MRNHSAWPSILSLLFTFMIVVGLTYFLATIGIWDIFLDAVKQLGEAWRGE